MAKGQQRSNREPKKPKKERPKGAAATPARFGSPSKRPAHRPVTAKSHSAAHIGLMDREHWC